MSILLSVKALIEAVGDVNATVYIAGSPINPPMPNVVVHQVSGSDEVTHSGPTGLNEDLVRVYSKAQTDKTALVHANAIRRALNGYRGSVAGHDIQLIHHRNRNTDYDSEAGIFRQIDDYRIHYSEV